MFGSFFSNILNFPFLVASIGLITLTCVFSASSVSLFTLILTLTVLRTILIDICALLSPSFIEIWISASLCLTFVVSVPVGLCFGLIVCGLSKFAKSMHVRVMIYSFIICVVTCTWLGFFHGNQLLLMCRIILAYTRSIISTISLIQICYLRSKFNSKFQSVTLCLVLLISTFYPDLKRQFITKFSSFELVDSSLSTSLVTIVNDHELDVKIMRIDHSIVGGVFNEGFESVFETFYWYELACHVPWMTSSPKSSEKHSLVIGCGVGIVVDALINRCKFDQVIVVDNNADVFNFASKYFGLSQNASLINADGLEFIIIQDNNTFDLIVHDVFSGSLMRNNYMQELISNCFRILSNNGILVLNMVSTVQMEVLHSVIQQLQSIFKQIKCFCEGGINSVKTDALVNFIFFASKSDELLQFDISNYKNNNGQNNHHRASESAFRKLRSSEIQLTKPENYEKIDQHKIEWFVAESHFKSMRNLLPASFWLLY
ncbi:hypothetical protein I4U23_016240 [Adineta vaga]|nr:hypothetical protein I4U23_016240 [Adineta vaga]